MLIARHLRRILWICGVLAALPACASNTESRAAEKRGCLPSEGSEQSVQRLLTRARDWGMVLRDRKWDSESQYYDPAERSREASKKRREGLALTFKYARVLEYRPLRVALCGDLAVVVDRTTLFEGVGRDPNTPLTMDGWDPWILRGGEWYLTDEARRRHGSTNGRNIEWNESGWRFWMTNPCESFTQAWLDPEEAKAGDSEAEGGDPCRDSTAAVEGAVRTPVVSQESSSPSVPSAGLTGESATQRGDPLQGYDLDDTACGYAVGVTSGLVAELTRYWVQVPGHDAEELDDVLQAVRAARRDRNLVTFDLGSIHEIGDRADLEFVLKTSETYGAWKRQFFTTHWVHQAQRWFRVPTEQESGALKNAPGRKAEKCPQAGTPIMGVPEP